MDRLIGNTTAESLSDHPDPAVIYDFELFDQSVIIQIAEIIGQKTVYMLLQGTDGFHQSPLKVITDTHNLSGCFHLCRQSSLCRDEFIKGKARDLYYAVVQHGLKACIGFSGNGILDLIQRITESDLRCYLCDGVSGSLTCQCRRTADTGVYLDYAVLKAFRMKGELHVTASGDLQLGNDVQGRGTEHLIFFISQCLRGSNYDTVSGMNTYRVKVFHVADGDHVSGTVTHYLILDLFPAGDAALYQNLAHTGKTESVLQDLYQFFVIVRNTAAASSKRIRRTEYDRVTDLLSKGHTIFYIFNNQGSCDGLTDLLHGFLEFQTVLCFFDGL